MMSHPCADGITDTVPHDTTTSQTADQITAGQDTPGMPVIRPDRRLPGDVAAITSRDGRAFAGRAESTHAGTGEITSKLPGS